MRRTPLKKSSKKRPYKRKKEGLKRKSVKTLKVTLDRVFSVFIRLRDSDKNGYATCFTSGKKIWWRETQCGHFMYRRYNSTRYHEQNCHAQTVYENCYLAGNQFLYGQKLNQVYGEGTAEKLVLLAKEDFKFTIDWLEERIEHYKKEVISLKKQKGLK